MTDTAKFWFEYSLKIVAALAAAFGVWKFFLDKEQSVSRDALLRSLSYIQAYGSGEHLQAREYLFDFWVSHQSDVKYLMKEPISHRVYSNFLNTAFEEAENSKYLYQAIFKVTYLFDQVYFCSSRSLCDRESLDAYFCPVAVRFLSVYRPIIERDRSSSGIETYGAGLELFVTSCPN